MKKKYKAIENYYGHIEIKEEKKYNNQIIINTVLYLQYQNDIEGFYDSLSDDECKIINDGYEVNITNKQILIDYIDAKIL